MLLSLRPRESEAKLVAISTVYTHASVDYVTRRTCYQVGIVQFLGWASGVFLVNPHCPPPNALCVVLIMCAGAQTLRCDKHMLITEPFITKYISKDRCA